ncbi:hypothetical protein F5Y18DRAFT_418157 [Xylariaceae sp. FL1019]|nr:hypothetical protein F5Y18DRAFT_418157 [Xylariaceae sp. FL1019]
MTPPLITLEEHFISSAAKERLAMLQYPIFSKQWESFPETAKAIWDTDTLRLASMDKNGVSLQVMSHVPGVLSVEECRAANDEAAAAVKANPSRLAGFAELPIANSEDCAVELRRCVNELGFVGALIGNHANGVYYEGYSALWQAAQDLDVPIYLHPAMPTAEQANAYCGGDIPPAVKAGISQYAWGWHSDVATHVLQLFGAGVFDKFPRLKLIIGHFGEMLPFMVDRVQWATTHWEKRQRPFRQVYEENIWITTSGVWSVDPMATILRNTPINKILYSVDYPFTSNEDGLKFMKALEESGLVTNEQLECIAYKNAERLLKVKATKVFD